MESFMKTDKTQVDFEGRTDHWSLKSIKPHFSFNTSADVGSSSRRCVQTLRLLNSSLVENQR